MVVYWHIGEDWFERRNLLTPAFHATVLNDFFDIMVRNCQTLMKRLENEADSQEFDIFPYINDCTVDIIAGKHFIGITIFSTVINNMKPL